MDMQTSAENRLEDFGQRWLCSWSVSRQATDFNMSSM